MNLSLIDVVVKAGDILLEGLQREVKATYKGKSDIVTEIDLKSETFLKEELQKIFKGYGIVAEETSNKLIDEANVIYIDPLDGTTNYYHRFPFFAISVAIYKEGLPVDAVVYNPYYKELFVASKGEGAYLNNRKIFVSNKRSLDESLIVTGYTMTVIQKEGECCLEMLKKISEATHGIRKIGSAALDLCYTAMGVFDGFYEKGLKAWDVAAGKLIVTEAGGKISDLCGKDHEIDSESIVATNSIIHDELLAILNEKRC
jgi:myo-inositol-1(or 4)-monophosphatase